MYEQAATLYREAAYNVQRTKADHGQNEAYSRACGIVDNAWSLLVEIAKRENKLAEATAFVNATYDNR